MLNIQIKIKQRQALESAYGNFAEPYVKQLIEVPAQTLATAPVAFPCFCYVSGWLLLTFLYCVWMRWGGAAYCRKKATQKPSG